MAKSAKSDAEPRQIQAIRIQQWMKGWDKVSFSPKEHRRKPDPYFYIFSLPAIELRSLCGISRRHTSDLTARADDMGIQRQHEPDRSEEISRFVEFGYPWSTLSEVKRRSDEFNDLRKPGWLPTAIVINILKSGDERGKSKVTTKDLVKVQSTDLGARITLPYSQWTTTWRPDDIPPLEVIDGQHRLWAFDSDSDSDFELPVVAFHGLDISWQAYLFWTINIKPKRINPSLAYDLYPLLRAEDWLDRAEGHAVYRETRAQELTEALWSNENSPWYDRINMLGEKQNRWVTQSAWIKSLTSTFVRPWHGRRQSPGGLFGSRMQDGDDVLGWSRAQQAAFLIYSWQQLRDEIQTTTADWAKKTINEQRKLKVASADQAPFYGSHSLLVTDQGVRGFLHVLNDISFTLATKLELRSWKLDLRAAGTDETAVNSALKTLNKHKLAPFLKKLARELATFDWRTSSDPSVSDSERRQKLVFRGSSGYKEIRAQLLEHLSLQDNDIGRAAKGLV